MYTLVRYTAVALGTFAVLQVIQIDWAKFGWIAAALSVGLGFGLQEIVANFISGLILLFERPIRVGDIVTLITSTILNWTLSAPVNRITIPVGVAYGSDTQQAMRIMTEVARAHRYVLEDPEPFATFEGFGDSSLRLVLRAFLPDMDNYLGTITDLHQGIARRFAEANVQIAFPQRDLHLRGGWRELLEERQRLKADIRPEGASSDPVNQTSR